MDAGSASGGSFVTPQFLVAFVGFRTGRLIARLSTSVKHFRFLRTVWLSTCRRSNSGTTTGRQHENTGIPTGVPTDDGPSSITLTTQAGRVPISQQLFDRAGFAGNGGTFDAIIGGQIHALSLMRRLMRLC